MSSDCDQNSNSNWKFTLNDDESLEKTLNYLLSNYPNLAKEKFCVVSIIGKSSFGCNACKAAIIDEAIGSTIFRPKFCQQKKFVSNNFCDVEGFVDAQNKAIFLHVLSHFDTDVLTQIVTNLSFEVKSKGNFNLLANISYNTARVLLLLFIISHIIVIVNPVSHFDLNYLHLFRLLNTARVKTQSFVIEILKEFPNISNHWIYNGRPCSPRVLFFFEAYQSSLKSQILRLGKRKLERHLEDQIYRFLRKSRIITNICANSLFAVCSQSDFVYISTTDPAIRDAQNFFFSLLQKYCSPVITEGEEESNSRNFYSFLWPHINLALTKGFDDNFGRHTFFFELPAIRDFLKVLIKLKKPFLAKDGDSSESSSPFSHLRTSLDIDRRYSENRCTKVLPIALNVYQEGLPTHYTLDLHSRKLSQALQMFTVQSRGPAFYEYAEQLKQECDAYWQNGRQMCEVMSVTNNNCINPVHKVGYENGEVHHKKEDEGSNSVPNQLPVMPHCSGIMITSACDCGGRQATRNDPFTVKEANYDFYVMIAQKCNCATLERIKFSIFEPSITDYRPAQVVQYTDRTSSMSDNECSFESQPESSKNSLADFYQDLNPRIKGMKKHHPLSNHAEAEQSQPVHEIETVRSVSSSRENSKEHSQQEVASPNRPSSSPDSDAGHWASDEFAENENNQGHEDDEDADEEDADEEDEEDQDEPQPQPVEDDDDDNRVVIRDYNDLSSEYGLNYETSTTEYLPRMLHSLIRPGLLPRFSSWSLVCLGASSIYSHALGIQDQPGFILGTNFLLPWDVTVKLQHSGTLPLLWEGKRPPGIKNKKNLKDGTQFTVKIFLGMEYECPRGHRFMASKPSCVLKPSLKTNANAITSSDMPLFMLCVCSRSGKEMIAQLMRFHVVTPKAPINVTLEPKVQPNPHPSPFFYPGNTEPIKLSQAAYWVLRFPFVYEGDNGVIQPYKDKLDNARLLKGICGISDYIYKAKS